MRFNKALPYSSVGGCPGVSFLQNGLYFSQGGDEVEIVHVDDGEGGKMPVGRVKIDATDDLMPPLENMPVDTLQPQDPETMHWRHLKVLVEQYGGTWTNRADAIAFLKKDQTDELDAA